MTATALLGLLAMLAAQDAGPEMFRVNGRTAVPMGAPDWIDPIDDYPAFARRADQDGGVVVARVFVNGSGRVTGCLIREHARVPVFETSTCRILLRRARFQPFTGAGLATFDYRIVWDLSRLPRIPRPDLSHPFR